RPQASADGAIARPPRRRLPGVDGVVVDSVLAQQPARVGAESGGQEPGREEREHVPGAAPQEGGAPAGPGDDPEGAVRGADEGERHGPALPLVAVQLRLLATP